MVEHSQHGASHTTFIVSGLLGSRRVVPSLLGVSLIALALSCSSTSNPTGQGSSTSMPGPTSSSAVLTVASTLDGHATLPHRIHWQATPSVPDSEVWWVEFLIDGQLAWKEQTPPYFFGDHGGYLTTTFLKPGQHTFTVRLLTADYKRPESTVVAAVAAPPSPPAGLAGSSWARTLTASERAKATSSEPPPTGRWGLRIDAVGWMIHGPDGGDLLFDVVYGADGAVQLRASIERPPFPSPTGGAFCDEPDQSALWAYTIGDGGNSLRLEPVKHDPCGDRLAILEGTWTRK
jgi:hypothetical protein